MKKNLFKIVLVTFVLLINNKSNAQTVLNADNIPNNTYELINGVFVKPGSSSTAVEAPDQIGVSANSSNGSHQSFGRHIVEVYDADLNKNVFAFYSHVNEDNDVSTDKTDRQRVEIKTFGSSPDALKGTNGEIVQYKWRFKIPTGWQPSSSFTHIHQVKAVDGDDSDPIFTLTLRKGTPNKLELIYVKDQDASSDKKQVVNLSGFENTWVQATETITIGVHGTYSINIKRVSDDVNVLSYNNSDIQTIRPGDGTMANPANSFIRPKWGIYRSIATPADLRDEVLYVSDISIEELTVLPINLTFLKAEKLNNGIQLKWQTSSEQNSAYFDIERSEDGKNFVNIGSKNGVGNSNTLTDYFFKDSNPIIGTNYYRLKQVDKDGKEKFSPTTSINMLGSTLALKLNLLNQSSDLKLNINTNKAVLGEFSIFDTSGKRVYRQKINITKGDNEFHIPFSEYDNGTYIAFYQCDNYQANKKFIK
ncbi:T9SS type A sorting domain-containing protein [Pedobacter sp. SD-b]|uniref:T9SS type A sorting domain-containing protein n=1 Tax=Pedobacter segetis TaxID=2793069 RepID=A0ABS1BHL9_9SPHI|nr:T9SS type A sorting domain-containing protein [Pedobacter segetis]MBK0382360.1 T9SS type A sorting domain-containing protein [Pedobacter segetis]